MSKGYGKLVLSVLAAGVVATPIASARTPSLERVGTPATVSCGDLKNSTKARHMDKIVFQISTTPHLVAASQADQASLDAVPRNSPLDIKVSDNPAAVADLKGKVLSFLGAADNADARSAITVQTVAYAVVCPTQRTVQELPPPNQND